MTPPSYLSVREVTFREQLDEGEWARWWRSVRERGSQHYYVTYYTLVQPSRTRRLADGVDWLFHAAEHCYATIYNTIADVFDIGGEAIVELTAFS